MAAAFIREIPLDSIRSNRYQPRQRFVDGDLAELAASIREHGVMQPVVLRPVEGGFELVSGERRCRAARLAGLPTVPALVRELSERDAAVLALVENLQREDLHFFEEAEGYQRLLDEFHLTQEELARQVGKGQSTIANKLRLLRLPDEVRQIISRENLSERHARALLRLTSGAEQLVVAENVVRDRLTVKETEALVEGRLVTQAQEGQGKPVRRRKVLGVFKDVRIVMNTLRKAVRTLQAAGVEVEMQEKPSERYYEVVIRIQRDL